MLVSRKKEKNLMHLLEKVFDEFCDLETIVIPAEAIPELTIAKRSRIKDGNGEYMALSQTGDGFTVLSITPAGVDPETTDAPVICQFFCLSEREPRTDNPSGASITAEQEAVLRRMGQRVMELYLQQYSNPS